ncbi:hypothetical protein [Frondihabitans cladoniiphilus]|uniref:Uncharacterized protein n=1 Tax=Frondihabitans cladoniiphilus TaxID=715785 RepID=A0ABP8W6B3_9MICO
MRAGRLIVYLVCVVASLALGVDGVRRLLQADYVWWTLEFAVAVALGLVAYRLRTSRHKRR